jgi:hydroxyacylglutathione hydrolase
MLQVKHFTFSPIQENTYIVYNEENECIIIDPGCYFDEEKDALKHFINEKKLKPVLLLNTHCHLDHVFGNKWVAETYGLILQIHLKEKELLEAAPAFGLMYEMPFDNYTGELIFLKEGDKIHLGKDELFVLETPGHSPGSICFYCAGQHFIISGDVLFQQSVGRSDLPGGDHQTLINSIRTKLLVLPDDTIVYSGHGDETTIEEEKKNNPFLN